MSVSRLTVLRLTEAERSALECSGVLDGADDLTPEQDVLRLAIQAIGSWRLVVSPGTQDMIAEAVNDLSNSEDAAAERRDGERSRQARRASRALARLYVRVRAVRFPTAVLDAQDATLATEPDLPCECGCGRTSPGGRLEAAHPEDYRDERG